jgi:hypothetical protein
MFILTAAILLISKLLLAGKDAVSYLLDEDKDNIVKLTNRWHQIGAAVDVILTGLLMWASGNYYEVAFQSLLIRLAVYDLAFNYFAKLDIHHIGTTAISDKIFAKIFGSKGAVKKSLFFLAALAVWGVLDLIL